MTAGSKTMLLFPHFQQHFFRKGEGISPPTTQKFGNKDQIVQAD